jgi:hypothetical protein
MDILLGKIFSFSGLRIRNRRRLKILGFCSEMIAFDSGQGRSGFETAGDAALRRGFQVRENTGLGRKMPFLKKTRALPA